MIGQARPRALPMTRAYEEEFLAAFDEYADALFRHACFRLSDREKATDITQETFIKAWEYVRTGNEIQHWKAFLYRVLNNLVIDEYRRKKEQSLDALLEEKSLQANVAIAIGGRTEHEEQLDEELLIKKIHGLISDLPEQQRAVLTLRYIDDFSPKEIAHTLNISENVASVRIHRAVEHLKKLSGHLTQS
jgi:RNA polymerase sigma-70 factor, ECF subfamily